MSDWISRDAYIDQLIESSMREAKEMEAGFAAWSAQHVPTWRELGRDETWIRLRVASAQSTRTLHRTMQARGFTNAERRLELRRIYEGLPDMYDLMVERTGQSATPPPVHGTMDLHLRAALRILVHDADEAAYVAYCRWAGVPPLPFEEQTTIREIRDFSSVEELEMALLLAQHMQTVFQTDPPLTRDQIAQVLEAYGAELRVGFIARFGYPPEQTTTPRVPVTIDGPVDRDDYFAARDEAADLAALEAPIIAELHDITARQRARRPPQTEPNATDEPDDPDDLVDLGDLDDGDDDDAEDVDELG